MEPGEHERMAAAEERHWWYRGLRDVLARCLSHPDLAVLPGSRVLDAGCGTGANLRMLEELLRPSYLGGFDTSPQALRIARSRGGGADLYEGDICDPEIHVDELDLVLSLDVIYIPGAERARGGLRRIVDRLRRGGLVVFNLPAYDWLYSEHDLAIHTRERYTTRRVAGLLDDFDLAVERLTYRVFFPFPLIVLARLPGMLRVRRGRAAPRSDLARRRGGGVLDALLFRALRLENGWIARGGRLPWGSSVFAVGRKV